MTVGGIEAPQKAGRLVGFSMPASCTTEDVWPWAGRTGAGRGSTELLEPALIVPVKVWLMNIHKPGAHFFVWGDAS